MILEDFHDFCKEKHLNYSLGFGTMLGAVRHKGFIPWDDDIDVIMPRGDYELFIETYNGKFKLLTPNYNNKYHYNFSKLIDNSILLIEDEFPEINLGPYIDIFPIDSIPDGNISRYAFFFLLKVLDIFCTIKRLKINKKYSILKNIILIFGKLILSFIDENRLIMINEFQQKKYSNIKTHYMSILPVSFTKYERIWFSKIDECIFENKKFMIFSKYDKILKSFYGDYMVLPNEKDRISHHKFILKNIDT